MSRFINVAIALILMCVSIYVINFIPTVVDFSTVVVKLEENDTIYRFLIYLPLIICIFNSLMNLCNTFADNLIFAIMGFVLCVATSIYIFIDVLGSVSAIMAISDKLKFVNYINIFCCALYALEFALHYKKIRKENLKES